MTDLTAPSIRLSALTALATAGITVVPFPYKPGDEDCLRGTVDAAEAIATLRAAAKYWQEVPAWLRSPFHTDLGPDRVEFRSYTIVEWEAPICPTGSVQAVISPSRNEIYADVDHTNPTQDGWGLLHHAYDVAHDDGPTLVRKIGRWFRRLFSK